MSEAKSADGTAGLDALLEHLRAGIETQLQTHQKENERLRAELDRCMRETASLRAELDEIRVGKTDLLATRASQSTSQNQQDLRSDPETVPWTTYAELKKKYENYYETSKSAFATSEHYKLRYQKAKTLMKAWHDYAEKCQQRLNQRRSGSREASLRPPPRLPDLPSSRPASAGWEAIAVPSEIHLDAGNAQDHPVNANSGPKHNEDDDQSNTQGPVEERAGPAELPEPIVELPAEADVPGSTQDSDETSGIVTHRSSSAPPQSSYHEETKFCPKHADGTLSGPIHIKSEPPSSPPVESSMASLRRVETFDLDETGTPIVTPRRKQRQADFLRTQAASASFPAHGSGHRRPNWLGEAQGRHALLAKSRKIQPQHGKKRKTSYELGQQIEELAEDGDPVFSKQSAERARKKAKGDQRIDNLLENTTPAKKQLIAPVTTTSRTAKQGLTPSEMHLTMKMMTPSAPTTQAMMKTKQEGSSPADTIAQLPTPATVRLHKPSFKPTTAPSNVSAHSTRSPQHPTRLRDRPIAELTPENFKLNPRASGGLTFATADPIRNRDDRRAHMQGCTDPACPRCSDELRPFAAELDVTVGSALFASTQEERLTEEERLFKHYLGDAWRDHLRGQSAQQRELIKERAKLKIVADRVGIHRIRPNERAKSPPGFWDVEMPTTQDMEGRAEEARKRQAVVVEERHREAMRGVDGRWMFKDE